MKKYYKPSESDYDDNVKYDESVNVNGLYDLYEILDCINSNLIALRKELDEGQIHKVPSGTKKIKT